MVHDARTVRRVKTRLCAMTGAAAPVLRDGMGSGHRLEGSAWTTQQHSC
jgi:hypothetical protein